MSASALSVHRFPQSSYIDSVRWLSPFVLAATSFPSLQILSLTPERDNLSLLSTWHSPSRITSLSTSPISYLIAAATYSGSIHIISTDPNEADFGQHTSLKNIGFHFGPVSCVDLNGSGSCISVGEDGRVNVVSLSDSKLSYRRVWDSDGLVGYNTAKWASPNEFATGGVGFGMQWWDLRKNGGPAAQLKQNWPRRATSGIVHSIDIHTSRKHTCLAGGSAGTVFAWDLRWQHQPIVLSGVGLDEKLSQSPSESEVWKVQYDNYTSSLNMDNISSSRILPAMICSEDGILSVVEEGEEPYELLAEPCAINSFDINQENPSDVICSLEWESITVVTRH